ncbi:DUF4230 domain-containing protein [Haloferula sp. A504]|uniref:DUF4230 domain-containing protein n=1 Tax=Haloferula sp. A504 TaxID=3373601 RepID=UPI0031BC946B|nr:DUF4230 domain-containing protein [Verrucomicrobiaceae bacterium E54]
MEYYPQSQGRKKVRPILLIMGVVVLSVTGLLLATCGDSIVQAPATAAGERAMEKVGRQIQKVLGRTVTIHSDGIVAFPREVCEVVLENHDIQASTRYRSTGWFGWGKSHVVMGGTYRAKVGFDLGKASAEVEDGVLRLWLPKPRVLAFETLKVRRQTEDVSWWNPLEPAEMEAAYRANRAEAERRLDDPELLKGATKRLVRRMRDGLGDLGLDVRVEILPPPPA